MKRTQPGKVLRARLPELDIVAYYANNVRLLSHRFFKIAERGHGAENKSAFIVLENQGQGNAITFVQSA